MKLSSYGSVVLALAALLINGFGSISSAADYKYNGPDQTLKVITGQDSRGQNVRVPFRLVPGYTYSDYVISKLDPSQHAHFVGYRAARVPTPAGFEDDKYYRYHGRSGPVEIEISRDPIDGSRRYRTVDLENGGSVSGRIAKKLPALHRDHLRALAPAALVTTIMGVAATSVEASAIRVNEDLKPEGIRLDSSNAGNLNNDLDSEISASTSSATSARRSTAK